MEIELKLHRETLLVRLRGELDHHSSGQLRQAVERDLEKGRARNVVFSLQGLSFMDSAGVGVLLGRYRRIKARGGRMAVCSATEAVSKLLKISGILSIIPLFSGEQEALEHMIMGREPQRRSEKL